MLKDEVINNGLVSTMGLERNKWTLQERTLEEGSQGELKQMESHFDFKMFIGY